VLEALTSGVCLNGTIGPLGISLIEEAHDEAARLRTRLDAAEAERADLSHDLVAIMEAISQAQSVGGACRAPVYFLLYDPTFLFRAHCEKIRSTAIRKLTLF
jgi:hypothetical protein